MFPGWVQSLSSTIYMLHKLVLSYTITNKYSGILFVFGLEIIHVSFQQQIARIFKMCIVVFEGLNGRWCLFKNN